MAGQSIPKSHAPLLIILEETEQWAMVVIPNSRIRRGRMAFRHIAGSRPKSVHRPEETRFLSQRIDLAVTFSLVP